MQSVLSLIRPPIASVFALLELPTQEFNTLMIRDLYWLQWREYLNSECISNS